MGVMQRSLSPLGAKNSPLRVPFVGAVLVLVCIWSLLSMDMSKLQSTVEPVYTEVVDSMKQAEDEAVRIALGSVAGNAGSWNGEPPSVVVEVPPQASDATSNVVEQTKTPEEATKETLSSRPLVLYAYSESETARPNLEFFIQHALNSAADFVFILNGPTNATDIIPELPNLRIVQRDNDCYDLGAYAEVLQKNDLWKKYGKFIMLNASLRGPFMPYWSNDCWMDMYLRKLTEEVKLVGMTANCWPTFHVQSMIWATDSIGLSTLLFPPEYALQYLAEKPIRLPPAQNKERLPSTSPALTPTPLTPSTDDISPVQPPSSSEASVPAGDESRETTGINKRTSPSLPGSPKDLDAPKLNPTSYRFLPSSSISQPPGINACFHTWDSAVAAEVSSTSLIRAAGYKIDVLMAAFHGVEEMEKGETCEENGDVLFEGGYFGGEISVWETGWSKTNREVDDESLELQTNWVNRRGYSSFDFCKAG